jgi:hypothetical protein
MNYDLVEDVLRDYNAKSTEEPDSYIIFLGGIGDFLTLDYVYNFSEKNNIIFISAQSLKLRKLLKDIPILKKKYYAIYFDFKIINQPGFTNLDDINKYFPDLKSLNIVSIGDYFVKIRENINKNNLQKSIGSKGLSKIINVKLINNIKKNFNLPNNFVFIAPFTEDNRVNCIKCNELHSTNNKCILTRNFILPDYHNTCVFLKNRNLIGVIISTKEITFPDNIKNENILINLSNKTTLLEAIEILKVAKYYIGIDNLFSVIASKILPKYNIFIKSNNKHLYNNEDVYYFPHVELKIDSFIKFR